MMGNFVQQKELIRKKLQSMATNSEGKKESQETFPPDFEV